MRELKSIIIKLKYKDKREFVIKILDEFIIKYPNNIYAKIEYSKLLFYRNVMMSVFLVWIVLIIIWII